MAHPFVHSRLLKCVFALSICLCCIFWQWFWFYLRKIEQMKLIGLIGEWIKKTDHLWSIKILSGIFFCTENVSTYRSKSFLDTSPQSVFSSDYSHSTCKLKSLFVCHSDSPHGRVSLWSQRFECLIARLSTRLRGNIWRRDLMFPFEGIRVSMEI